MKRPSSIAVLLFSVIVGIGGGLAARAWILGDGLGGALIAVTTMLVASVAAAAPKVADAWERAVVLRLGRLHAVRGPGAFAIVPGIDAVVAWVDTRITSTTVRAAKALSKDGAAVDVEIDVEWRIAAPEKSFFVVVDVQAALGAATESALRNKLGQRSAGELVGLGQILADDVQHVVQQRAEAWGLEVTSIAVRRLSVPAPVRETLAGARREPVREIHGPLGAFIKRNTFDGRARLFKHHHS